MVVHLYGEVSLGIIGLCTGTQTMLYLICTLISSVDLAHYAVSCAKDWVSVDCGRFCVVLLSYQILFINIQE